MKKLISIIYLVASSFGTFAADHLSGKDSAAHYLKLGAVEEAKRKYNNAWLYYEKATRFDSSNAEAFLHLADVCFLINKKHAAIQALEAASVLLPRDYSLQWKLIRIYYDYGQYMKVTELLPNLRSRFTETPGWALMLGKSYYLLPNPDYNKAIACLKSSLKEEHPNGEAAYLIARMLLKMENYEAAIPFFKLSISLDSARQPARVYDLAMLLFTTGKPKESVLFFKQAEESGYPRSDDFDQNYAMALADASRPEEAVVILERLLVRRSGDKGIITALADISYQSGSFKKAIGYWRQLLELDPGDARVLYQAGICYIGLGNEKYGKALCDKAIEMDPKLEKLRIVRKLF